MKNPLISVIVPCYNSSKYLNDLIASFQAQTYKNVEYIFVDDGSKDNTLSVLSILLHNSKLNFKILSQTNSGPSMARNYGLSKANGDLIYFCDSDDVLDPNALIVLEKIIRENDADLACFHSRHVRNSFKFKNKVKSISKLKVKTTYSADNIVSLLLSSKKQIGFGVFNHIYKLSILKQISNFPNVFDIDCFFGEDLLFNLKYCSKCNKSVFVNKILYNIRLSKNSLVRSEFSNKKLSTFKIVDFFNSLDQTKFFDSIPYLKTYVCFTCMDFLLKISKSEFNDKKVIKSLYEDFKNNLKYCKQGKLTPWYRKYFMWVTVPIVWIVIKNKI